MESTEFRDSFGREKCVKMAKKRGTFVTYYVGGALANEEHGMIPFRNVLIEKNEKNAIFW